MGADHAGRAPSSKNMIEISVNAGAALFGGLAPVYPAHARVNGPNSSEVNPVTDPDGFAAKVIYPT